MGNSNATSFAAEEEDVEKKTVESQPDKPPEDPPVYDDNGKLKMNSIDEDNGVHEKSREHFPSDNSALTNDSTTVVSRQDQGDVILIPSHEDAAATMKEGDRQETETSTALESEDLVNPDKLLDLPSPEKIENTGSQQQFHLIEGSAFKVVPDHQETDTFPFASSDLIRSKTCNDRFGIKGESEVVPQELMNSTFHSNEGKGESEGEEKEKGKGKREGEEQEIEMLSSLGTATDTDPNVTDQVSGETTSTDVQLQPDTVMEEAEEQLLVDDATCKTISREINGYHECENGILFGDQLFQKQEPDNQTQMEPILGLLDNEEATSERNNGLQEEGIINSSEEASMEISKEENRYVKEQRIEVLGQTKPCVTPADTDVSGKEQFWNVISTIVSDETKETPEQASVESDTENSSSRTTSSHIQKSPSFHLDVRSESDQTPHMLCHNFTEDGISFESPVKDKSELEVKAPFSGFRNEVEEENPKMVINVKEEEEQQTDADNKENFSVKGKEKSWWLRSSLFGTCISCGTVMNETAC